MTTIIYHHESRTIATDGRETDSNGHIHCDTLDKIYYLDGGDVIALAGPSIAIDYIVKHYDALSDTDSTLQEDAELLELLLSGDGHVSSVVYSLSEDEFYEWHLAAIDGDDGEPVLHKYKLALRYTIALGSGAPFAIAALDFGKSVFESIGYASTRDSSTGGAVRRWQAPDSGPLEDLDDGVYIDTTKGER